MNSCENAKEIERIKIWPYQYMTNNEIEVISNTEFFLQEYYVICNNGKRIMFY